jgi:hypothetical protein
VLMCSCVFKCGACCRLLLRLQNVELVAERDELIGRLTNVEQVVKQREGELVHVHQQYQVLYQQFAALQIHYSALEQRFKVYNIQNFQDFMTYLNTLSIDILPPSNVSFAIMRRMFDYSRFVELFVHIKRKALCYIVS